MSLKNMMNKTSIKVSDLSNPKKQNIKNDKDAYDYLENKLGDNVADDVKKIVNDIKEKPIVKTSEKPDPPPVKKVDDLPKIKRKNIVVKSKKISNFSNKLYIGQHKIMSIGKDGLIVIDEYPNGEIKRRVVEKAKSHIRLFGSKRKY